MDLRRTTGIALSNETRPARTLCGCSKHVHRTFVALEQTVPSTPITVEMQAPKTVAYTSGALTTSTAPTNITMTACRRKLAIGNSKLSSTSRWGREDPCLRIAPLQREVPECQTPRDQAVQAQDIASTICDAPHTFISLEFVVSMHRTNRRPASHPCKANLDGDASAQPVAHISCALNTSTATRTSSRLLDE